VTEGEGPVTRDDQAQVPVHRMVTSTIDGDQLAATARLRMFFAHQSVGGSLVDALPDVYAEQGLPAPGVRLLTAPAHERQSVPQDGPDGFVAHATFGQNGDARAKIEDFDARLRAGLGRELDVALMKLCYADVTSGTDVDAVFAAYRRTLAALVADFPDVTFLHVTTPVTTEPSWRSRARKALGRDPHTGPADNVARERLNAMVRRDYPADRVFDLAAVESTGPDGSRSSGTVGGRRYLSLHREYAADAGHLNQPGATVAAAQLLRVVADAAGVGRS
jgi:hypothetical protein